MFDFKSLKYILNETPVFSIEDLSLNPGEKILLEGKSGSGKSTFLKILGLLNNSYNGSVFYKGTEIKQVKNRELYRRNVLMMMQETFVPLGIKVSDYPDIIKQFKVYNGFNYNTVLFRDLLSVFNLDDSIINRNINEISVGERQRVVLANMIVLKPEVLLLDEPTSGLDSVSAAVVFNYLMNECSNMTIFCVSHTVEFFHLFSKKITFGSFK